MEIVATIPFILLSIITLVSALAVIFARNPVHSILYLVICLFSVAGHYILLSAEFLAVVQIIVYAGAIMVLFLFVVMMLNLNKDSEPTSSIYKRLACVTAGGALMLVVLAAVKDSGNLTQYGNGFLPEKFGQVSSIGQVLFKEYLVPFEISSILFIAAMVGAVLLGKKHIDD